MKNTMNTKIWGIGFPNSVVDFDPSRTFQDLQECGVDEYITCACIYNGYRLMMPRNEKRYIYSLEEGKLFFESDLQFYSDCKLKPVRSDDFKKTDVLDVATREAKKIGIKTAAWYCYFANGYIAKNHPECSIENMYGSKDRLFLCWNNPEVRKYSLAVTEDITRRYEISSIMADKIPQAVLELNVFSGRVDPLVRTLGSICFCEHCIKEAKKAGIDLEEVRKRAIEIADHSRRIPPHIVNALHDELKGDHEVPLFFLEEPIFYEVMKWRIETTVSFLKELKEKIRSIRKDLQLGVCYVPPVKIGHDASSPRPWLAAQSYKYCAEVADSIHSVIHWDADTVAYDTRRAALATQNKCELVVHLKAYGSTRPRELADIADGALEAGADSLAFFCYDLFSDSVLEAIQAWSKR
jgi:hypothetical protein